MEALSRREWGKGTGEKGQPDMLCLRYLERTGKHRTAFGEILWFEGKTSRGRVAPHQKQWHYAERARGALTLIAGEDFPATYEGFIEYYRRSGLCRREGL